MKRLDELGVSPDPWRTERFSPESTEDGRDIKDALSYPVGCTYTISDHAIADARLIAAAPDMYEALRLVLEAIDALGFKPVVESDPLALAVKCGEVALENAGGGE